MDGFKNSTKTQYSMGGYAKGGSKFGKVMGEFKAGTLHSGSKKGPEVTNPKQAVAIALSEARKAGAKLPVKKQLGGTLTDAERRLLQAEMNDMGSADRARVNTALGTPNVYKKGVNKPMSASDLAKKVKEDRENVRMSNSSEKFATKPATKGSLSASDRQQIESEYNDMGASDRARADALLGYKKGGSAQRKPSVKTADALRAQKYKAAMASRPNREPRIPVKDPAKVQMAAGAIKSAIEKAISTRAAQQPAPQAAPLMEAAAPPMMGAPAMKKGGKVSKRQDGGMATSIRPTKDYNASDKDFVSARAEQLKGMVGKAEGGKADLKQDKAMVKKAVHKHEAAMHPGKPMTKLRKGGMPC